MSYSNQTNLPSGQGSVLQTVFTGGVSVQANKSFVEMDAIRQMKMSSTTAREVKYLLETALGYAAAQARNPGTANRAFPAGQAVDLSEKTAQFKEFEVTVELPETVVMAQQGSPESYESLMALETRAKAIVTSRLRCAKFYLDGTGVHGTASAGSTSVGSLTATGQFYVPMSITDTSRGHAGCFEVGDIYVPKQNDGTTRTFTGTASSTIYGLKVLQRSHRTQRVYFQICGTPDNGYVAITGITATNLASGDVFYRVGQPTGGGYGTAGIDLTAISDYDTASEDVVGIESFSANDGRVVAGVTMSGATAGTRYDHDAGLCSTEMIEQLISDGEIAVGNGEFSWSMGLCHPLTRSALLRERETDRRFVTETDNKRGVKFLAFQHEDQTVRIVGREFVHPKRFHLLPTPRGADRSKPIVLIGSDYKPVKLPGQSSEWYLKATSGGYVAAMQSFMRTRHLFLNQYPAAILTAHNFTNTIA